MPTQSIPQRLCAYCNSPCKKKYCNRTCYHNGASNGRHSLAMGDRFAANISHNGSGCWEWQGSKIASGYGQFRLHNSHKVNPIGAHRLSYIIYNGEIPEGLFVCHHCDNPPCVNPDHLFLGTNADNMHDRFNKGRYTTVPRGENHWRVRLRESDIPTIRNRAAQGENLNEIGQSYGVSHATIGDIVDGITWKHVK